MRSGPPVSAIPELEEWLSLETTTLWDFPFQSPPGVSFGDAAFGGVTPSGVVRNLVLRFTRQRDWIVDPMAGSGTTLDVARSLGRRALGFDISPRRPDIHHADARELPLPPGFVKLVFIDPPYGDNLSYSRNPTCLGHLPCDSSRFFEGLREVAAETRRILHPGGVCAWLISDQFKGGKFTPVGFRLFCILRDMFRPQDIIAVSRRNDRSLNPQWEHWSRTVNFFLRGFKYLLIFRSGGVP